MRLDVYLTEHHIYASRTRAERAVKEGCVAVNGVRAEKCSLEVSENDTFSCLPDPVRYVSRGALKLCGALSYYPLRTEGITALDVGASTGGFTQVLLENGAAKVVALDVGSGQLSPELAADPRVENLEKTDVRALDPERFGGLFDAVVCDCSFISLKLVLPCAVKFMKPGGWGVFLIKPQFEAGRGALNKKGVVRDEKTRLRAVAEIEKLAGELGLRELGPVRESPVTGGDGNTEYLLAVILPENP